MVYHVRSIILIVIDAVCLFFLYQTFLPAKANSYKHLMLFAIAALSVGINIISMVLIPYIAMSSWFHIAINFVLVLIFFQGGVALKAFLSVYSYLAVIASDVTCTAILIYTYKADYSQLFGVGPLAIFRDVGSRLLLIVLIVALHTIGDSRKLILHIPNRDIALLMFVSVTSTFSVLAVLNQIDQATTTWLTVLASVLLLFMTPAIFFLLRSTVARNKGEADKLLLEQQVTLQKSNIEVLSSSFREQRTLMHDYDNQLAIISQLLAVGNYDRVAEYVQILSGKATQSIYRIKTGNDMIDAILNAKDMQARGKDILFEVYAGDLRDIPITDDDMLIILTNTIDNAINATLPLTDERRVVIRLNYSESKFRLSVKNRLELDKISADNESTTPDFTDMMHGYGLKNVAAALAHYGSTYVIDCSDSWFHFAAVIAF